MASDPILGPAWPQLLAPGLRVVHPLSGAATVVMLDDDGDPWVVYDGAAADPRSDVIEAITARASRLSVDYRHAATLDAAARAVAAALGWPETLDCPRWQAWPLAVRGVMVHLSTAAHVHADGTTWWRGEVPDLDPADPDAGRKAIRAVVAHVLGGAP